MVTVPRYLTSLLVCALAASLTAAGEAAAAAVDRKGTEALFVEELTESVAAALQSDPTTVPPPRALLFLMARHVEGSYGGPGTAVRKVLSDLAGSSLRDLDAGGFHRGDTKPVGLNAELLRAYATAYRVFGDEPFGELTKELAAFVAQSCQTDTDVGDLALAVTGLFEAAPLTGDESVRQAAERTLDRLLDSRSKATEPEMRSPAETVRVVEALLSAYEYTGSLRFREQAEEVFRPLREQVESDRSLVTSGQIALAAMRLSYMTDDKTYAPLAEKILNSLREEGLANPLSAGALGQAAEYRVTHPYKVIVIGAEPERRALHDAALRLPLANRIVLSADPSKDPQEMKRLKYPDMGKPVVFLCTDKVCSMPVENALNLGKTLARLRGVRRGY